MFLLKVAKLEIKHIYSHKPVGHQFADSADIEARGEKKVLVVGLV